MHEELIREFVERAEAGVRLPPLKELQDRGRRRHRNRLASIAAVAVFAAAATGVGILASTGGGEDRSEPPPAETPAVDLDVLVPNKQVAAGREYTNPVFGQDYAHTVPDGRQIVARFTVVGQDWYGFKDSIGKLAPGAEPDAEAAQPYAEVRISLADRVPVDQCAGTARWADAAGTPLEFSRQVAAIPLVRVLDEPATTELSGYPAAHMRLEVTRLCARHGDAFLWSVFPMSSSGVPGVAAVYWPGQIVDQWVVDVDGSLVVVSTNHSPELPDSLVEEAQATADSVELLVVDEE
jgi:hypothetical protein